MLSRLLRAQEGAPDSFSEYSAFLTRCFVCRVRCLLDSTSGFLTMQFQGKLRFLFGQKRKAPSGATLPPQLSLFCLVAPLILTPGAEMKTKGAFLRAKPRTDPTAALDTRARAATSQCESAVRGAPGALAGRRDGENSVPVFGIQMDAGRWARVPARAPCLCLRGGPNLVPGPEGVAGTGAASSSRTRMHKEAPRDDSRCPALGSGRFLDWTPPRLTLTPGRAAPFSCLPYAGVPNTTHTCGTPTLLSPPTSQPLGQPPGTSMGRVSKTERDGVPGQGQSQPGYTFSPAGVENGLPPPVLQRLPVASYPSRDIKVRGAPRGPQLPCSLALSLPVKQERDTLAEDTAGSSSGPPSQAWLGGSHTAGGPLKVEPDRGRLLGGPSGPALPTHSLCLEQLHSAPPPCAQGPQPPGPNCICRAPEGAPMVKREPLEPQGWASHSQGGHTRGVPKSALATLQLPRTSGCMFLP